MRKILVPCAGLLASVAGASIAFAGPCLTLATADDRSAACTLANAGPAGGGVTDFRANFVANVVWNVGATQLGAGPSGDIGILNSLAIGQAIGFEPFAPLLTVGGGVGGGPGGSGKSGGNGKGSGAPSGTSPHGTGTDPIQLVGYSPSTGNGGGVAPNDPPPTPVNTLPEPGALALLAAGLFGLAGVMALRRRQ